MKGLKRIKRGFSLVEVVISVAILVILLVPLATITLTTIQTSASAEDKQKATLIGQQLLAELNSKDDIPLTRATGVNDTFQLLNGQTLEVIRDTTTLKIIKIDPYDPHGVGDTFTVTDKDGVEYQVRLVMTREVGASYDPPAPTPTVPYNQTLYFYNGPKVNVAPDTTVGAVDANTHTILNPSNLILDIDRNMDIQLTDGTYGYPTTTKIHAGIITTTGGRILIRISNNYINNVTLNIRSFYTLPIIIDIVKETRTDNDITVNKGTPAGDIQINNNMSTAVPTTIGDLYRANVTVSRTGTGVLFDGWTTKNILFHY